MEYNTCGFSKDIFTRNIPDENRKAKEKSTKKGDYTYTSNRSTKKEECTYTPNKSKHDGSYCRTRDFSVDDLQLDPSQLFRIFQLGKFSNPSRTGSYDEITNNYYHKRQCKYRCTTELDHFLNWYYDYEIYIKDLFKILLYRSKENNTLINYGKFILFVYHNSCEIIPDVI